LFGEEISCTLPSDEGGPEFCFECIEAMAIRCAWCGKAIIIGDPITLLTPSETEFKIPEYAVVYNEEPLQLVGCLSWDCAPTGGARAGFWIPPGKVHRVVSPLEMVMGATGEKMVVVSDLTDIQGADEATQKFLRQSKDKKS
ncbi:MAG: hypothetical protein AAB642_02630, partial [Patescibacteria group bacterium]